VGKLIGSRQLPLNQPLQTWLVVVPARLASSRLPDKPLQDLGGLPLVVRVVRNLKPLEQIGAQVLVATDHERVVAACQKHQVAVELTSPEHASGSDRCQEIALRHPRPYVLNVQGDEPFIDTTDLLDLMRSLEQDNTFDLATLVHASSEAKLWSDPRVVKTVIGHHHQALYFSRSGIPFHREHGGAPDSFLIHIGVYAFKRDSLKKYTSLPATRLEQTEMLEQLRALEYGLKIKTLQTKNFAKGIDTPEDLEAARASL